MSEESWNSFLTTVSASTAKRYVSCIDSYKEFCTDENYEEADVGIVYKFMLFLREEEELKASTITSIISAVAQYFTFFYGTELFSSCTIFGAGCTINLVVPAGSTKD